MKANEESFKNVLKKKRKETRKCKKRGQGGQTEMRNGRKN